MKRALLLLFSTFLIGGTALLQQGCTIRFVQGPPMETHPYPNAWRIETRSKNQENQIAAEVQAGNLDPQVGQGLAENDHIVRQLSFDFRRPFNQTQDLTYDQAATLDRMLDENQMSFTDAMTRRDQWMAAFQGQSSYDFNSPQDRRLYFVYMNYRLIQQQNNINAGVNSGQLSRVQAQELRGRLQQIQNQKIDACRQGRIDVGSDQINKLSYMAEDNSHFLRYRMKGGRGNWDRVRASQWPEGADDGKLHQNQGWNGGPGQDGKLHSADQGGNNQMGQDGKLHPFNQGDGKIRSGDLGKNNGQISQDTKLQPVKQAGDSRQSQNGTGDNHKDIRNLDTQKAKVIPTPVTADKGPGTGAKDSGNNDTKDSNVNRTKINPTPVIENKQWKESRDKEKDAKKDDNGKDDQGGKGDDQGHQKPDPSDSKSDQGSDSGKKADNSDSKESSSDSKDSHGKDGR